MREGESGRRLKLRDGDRRQRRRNMTFFFPNAFVLRCLSLLQLIHINSNP